MVILISGTSHTGKTFLSSQIMKTYHMPYLSIDLLKMGLIRSGQTLLTPLDDQELTEYLWPILVKMIKTALENKQHIVFEGVYIPMNWQDSFNESELLEILGVTLILSKSYIEKNFDQIMTFANAIENRIFDDLDQDELLNDNLTLMDQCRSLGLNVIEVDSHYNVWEQFIAGFDNRIKGLVDM